MPSAHSCEKAPCPAAALEARIKLPRCALARSSQENHRVTMCGLMIHSRHTTIARIRGTVRNSCSQTCSKRISGIPYSTNIICCHLHKSMKSHICILASLTFAALLISACASKRQSEVASSQPITAVVTNVPIVISNRSTTNLPTPKATDAPLLAIISPTHASPAYVSNLIATTSLSDLFKAYERGLIGKGVMMQAMLMAQNRQPLDFYGKVIDQNGEPVVGATVEGGILLNKDFVHSASEAHYTITDSSGLFHFLGVHGVKMGIRPKKDG